MGKAATNKETRQSSGQETYIEFVDSLFADPKSLFVGVALQVCIMAAYIFETGQAWFYIFIVGAILGALWRLSIGHGYHASVGRLTNASLSQRADIAAAWERRFVVPSTATAANIGFFSFFGLELANSTLAVSIVIVLLCTPLPTIVGRIYGSRRLAGFLLAGQFTPVIFGYFALGGFNHVFLAILCLPYIALVLNMVDNVRATVIRAVEGNSEKVELGRQFDVALSNMSHGLIMFNENHEVLVMNEQAMRLFNLEPTKQPAGRNFHVLLRYAKRYTSMSDLNRNAVESAITALLAGEGERQQVYFDDGRYLELTINNRVDGGSVLTLEDVTERVVSALRIERMAKYDGLTGLANRQHFEVEVNEFVRNNPGKHCSLVVVDIDDFKYVNDAIGHAQGDALLCSVARILQAESAYHSTACRLGGDEFLVFISGFETPEDGQRHIDGLCQDVTGVHELSGEQIYASCSVGFVTMPTCEFMLDRAILSADLALYQAKATNKGGCRQFDKSMDDQYQRRQRIKKQLGKAVQSDGLSLIFQPLVDAPTGRLVSCEALSRWYDPEFGQLSPAEYIPLAEEMGIITQITGYMLNQATIECMKWPENISVSVNLSQLDFKTGDILSVISGALERSGLPPERLEVEVTETAVTSNEDEMIAKLQEIHALGVRIALDDFGTGQSSLSYLHRLPLDKVKIDRSFVEGIDTGETPISLLRGITDLCRTLDLDVTVEGVETQAQLAMVVEKANVDRIQGYIYGPGLPASGVNALARLRTMPIKDDAKSASVLH